MEDKLHGMLALNYSSYLQPLPLELAANYVCLLNIYEMGKGLIKGWFRDASGEATRLEKRSYTALT